MENVEVSLSLHLGSVQPLPKTKRRLHQILNKIVGRLVVVECARGGYALGRLEHFDCESLSLVLSWNGKLKVVKKPVFLKVLS